MSKQENLATVKRVYYMDYLRAFIVVMVVIHHSVLPYVMNLDWLVNSAVKSLPCTLLIMVNDVFMMPSMFFIAGYFAFPSMKKGIKYFVFNKVIRIVLPFFIGITFLAPIISYIGAIYHKILDVSFIYYWSNVYFKDFINPHHFWFLSLLFVFFCVFAAVYALIKNKIEGIYEKSKLEPARVRSIIFFVIFFLATAVALFYLTGRKYPDGSWYANFKFIIFQATRSTGYLLYFTMGIIVFIKRITFSKKFLNFLSLFIVVTIIASAPFLYFKFQIYYAGMGFLKTNIQFYNAMIHVFYCFLVFITLTAVFKKYLDRASRALSRLSRNSYMIYIVHMVYTILIQYYIIDIEIPVFLKILITAIGTLAMSIATSELLSKLISVSTPKKRYEVNR